MRRLNLVVVAVAGLWMVGPWMAVGAAGKLELGKPDKEGWIALFDGNRLTQWHARDKDKLNNWAVESDGMLHNVKTGTDLVSDVPLMDHELNIEFMVAVNGNSGVYLQGRYEVQVADSYGQKLGNGMCGAVYGKITPKENACLATAQVITTEEGQKRKTTPWQTFDIKFYSARLGTDGKVAKKARITVVQNGKKIIDNAEIDGLTGSAVDNKEGTPAGLMLQGDHSEVWYRNIKYRPIKEAE